MKRRWLVCALASVAMAGGVAGSAGAQPPQDQGGDRELRSLRTPQVVLATRKSVQIESAASLAGKSEEQLGTRYRYGAERRKAQVKRDPVYAQTVERVRARANEVAPELGGRIFISFRVSATGSASHITVVGFDREVDDAVEAVLRSQVFPVRDAGRPFATRVAVQKLSKKELRRRARLERRAKREAARRARAERRAARRAERRAKRRAQASR